MNPSVPHLRIVVFFCFVAVAGYAAFSVWAVFYSADAALRGDVIGTWKSFAVGAFAFWIGASSGGKIKDVMPTEPTPVNVQNTKEHPVLTEDAGNAKADL